MSVRPVTCRGCRTALAIVITCPLCRTPGAEEYGLPIPGTGDCADCARCTACGHTWGLDPGANAACTRCGGSGNTGRGTWRDPACPCREAAEDGPRSPRPAHVAGRTIPLRAPLDESGLPRKDAVAPRRVGCPAGLTA